MNLQNQFRFREILPQRSIHFDHRKLNDIRCRSLNGGVQCHALGTAADIEIAGFQLGDIAAAAVHGLGVAPASGTVHHVFHIGLHTGVVA